jgi:hypothetical protein
MTVGNVSRQLLNLTTTTGGQFDKCDEYGGGLSLVTRAILKHRLWHGTSNIYNEQCKSICK